MEDWIKNIAIKYDKLSMFIVDETCCFYDNDRKKFNLKKDEVEAIVCAYVNHYQKINVQKNRTYTSGDMIRQEYLTMKNNFPNMPKKLIREKIASYFGISDKAVQKHIYKKE